MRKWIIIVVIVGLLGYAVYDFTSSRSSATDNSVETEVGEGENIGLQKGQIAPNFELETLDGETVSLADQRGEKVIVNFWASWCGPCRAEMPDMQKFHEEYDATILAVNMLSTEPGEEQVQNFLDEFGVTFTALLDDDRVSSLYNISGLPTSYFINSKGEVHNIAVGPINYEMMEQVFDEMD